MNLRISLAMLVSGLGLYASGQSAYLQPGSMSVHLLDRFEIKSGRLADPLAFNTTAKYYKRSSVASYTDSFPTGTVPLSRQDYFNLDYLQNDNFEWSGSEGTLSRRPLLRGNIFRHKAAVADVMHPDYNIVINPIAYLQGGYDTRLKSPVMLNTRGIEIRGSVKNIFGFYTQFSDEINRTNSWVRDYYVADSVIPGAGFLKTTDRQTFNYALATGYITVAPSKYIDLQFGHGRNFIGNGYRTFYQSDFSRDHLFLRANTHFWRINYTNIWGMMYDFVPVGQINLPKRHYYATTHLSVNAAKNFSFGLFQTISYQRDSGYSNGGVELEYLNPIIFYKPIENGLNSPDKTILGIDLKYNFLEHVSLYGQLVISEFVLGEVLAGNGWWGNKQAYQVGAKYIDAFGVSNLDLQGEVNIARPYMYTSFDAKNAYVNYNQSMAHPLGANFREVIGIIRYQPLNRLFLKATGIFAAYGNDTGSTNWGKDIGKSYRTRQQEYGNTIAQGIRTNLYMADLTASFMIRHNVFIDLQVVYRKTGSALPVFASETILVNMALRWNISERRWDF